MSEEIAIRSLYGLSLSVHNLFAALPFGLSVIHAVMSLKYFRDPGPEGLGRIRLTFDFLVLSILLSAFSGFALELEFKRFWPDFLHSLEQWNHHIGHKSAILSFFLSSLLIGMTYYFKLWEKMGLYAFCSFIWIFLTWMFSGWGIFLNTVMQQPQPATLQEGILVLEGSLGHRFMDGYHLLRQAHIGSASLIKAAIWTLLLMYLTDKDLAYRNSRLLLGLMLGGFVITAATGHFQAVQISNLQPSKFAAMEGIFSESDAEVWKPLGFMDKKGNIHALRIPGGLEVLTHAEPVPTSAYPPDERPNVPLVFNAFRTMVFSFLILFALAAFLFVKRRRQSAGNIGLMFILVEIATLAGWVVSESGRQPWVIYGLMKREDVSDVPFISWSWSAMLANTFILIVFLILSFRYIQRVHRPRHRPEPG